LSACADTERTVIDPRGHSRVSCSRRQAFQFSCGDANSV